LSYLRVVDWKGWWYCWGFDRLLRDQKRLSSVIFQFPVFNTISDSQNDEFRNTRWHQNFHPVNRAKQLTDLVIFTEIVSLSGLICRQPAANKGLWKYGKALTWLRHRLTTRKPLNASVRKSEVQGKRWVSSTTKNQGKTSKKKLVVKNVHYYKF